MTREFYDAPKTISYGAALSMIITMRSRGKTYGFTKEAVKDYLRDGKEFIWVRRYDSELKPTAPKLIDDLIAHNEFPELEFKVQGYTHLVKPKKRQSKKWDTLCTCIPLSKQASFKGVAFPNVKKIIFDEFIRVLRTPPGYLRDDVGAFLDLYKTVSRDRDSVYAYLLGNACDLTCPYLSFAGLKDEPMDGYSWHRNKSILIHFEHNADFAREERLTTVGRLVEGTAYSDVMIDNVFANAGGVFISKKPKSAKYRYGFAWQAWRFGVWFDLQTGVYYITDKVPSDGAVYTLTAADAAPDIYMIERAAPVVKNLSRIFGSGALRFDSEILREQWLKMMQLAGLR